MDKENMVCIYNGYYSATRKKVMMPFAGKMCETRDHQVK
jgi:hypothetical protein